MKHLMERKDKINKDLEEKNKTEENNVKEEEENENEDEEENKEGKEEDIEEEDEENEKKDVKEDDKNNVLKVNLQMEKLILHSLAVVASINKPEKFPFYQLFESLMDEDNKGDVSLLELLNFDYSACTVFGVNEKNRLEVDRYYCSKCKNVYYLPTNTDLKKCFCSKKLKDKYKFKKYSKVFEKKYQESKKNKNQGLRINTLVKEPITTSVDKNIISFRIINIFKNCFFLGLNDIFPKSSKRLFNSNHTKEKIQSISSKFKGNKNRIKNYFKCHIEADLDYLKRIYKLKIKPYNLMHFMFPKIFEILKNVSDSRKVQGIIEAEEYILRNLTNKLDTFKDKINKIAMEEYHNLGINNELQTLEKNTEIAMNLRVTEIEYTAGVFEVHSFKQVCEVTKGNIIEELLFGKLNNKFLKEMFSYKTILVEQKKEASDDEEQQKERNFNCVQYLILAILEFSNYLGKMFEVEFDLETLIELKFSDAFKKKFPSISLEHRASDFDEEDGEENEETNAKKLVYLYHGFKKTLRNLMRLADGQTITKIFPFLQIPSNSDEKKQPELNNEFNQKKDFKKLHINTLKNLLENNDFTMSMLLINSQLSQKSIVMRLIECLGKFQNSLINKYGQSNDRPLVKHLYLYKIKSFL
jgi:hypothetical protein